MRRSLALSQSHALLGQPRRSGWFDRERTHRVLPLTNCPIAHEQINQALEVLSRHRNERPQALIRCGTATGQMLIQPYPQAEVREQLAGLGLDIRAETMEEVLLGETFRIRPRFFFQTNTPQAEKMAQMVLHGLLQSRTIVPSPLLTPIAGVVHLRIIAGEARWESHCHEEFGKRHQRCAMKSRACSHSQHNS